MTTGWDGIGWMQRLVSEGVVHTRVFFSTMAGQVIVCPTPPPFTLTPYPFPTHPTHPTHLPTLRRQRHRQRPPLRLRAGGPRGELRVLEVGPAAPGHRVGPEPRGALWVVGGVVGMWVGVDTLVVYVIRYGIIVGYHYTKQTTPHAIEPFAGCPSCPVAAARPRSCPPPWLLCLWASCGLYGNG